MAVGSRASRASLNRPNTSSTARFCAVSRMLVPGSVAWEQAAPIRQASATPSLMAAGCRHKMRIGGSENAMEGWIDVGPADLMEGELRGLEVGERLVLLARHIRPIPEMDVLCDPAACLISAGWNREKEAAGVC